MIWRYDIDVDVYRSRELGSSQNWMSAVAERLAQSMARRIKGAK
jgi:hypothetical protein